MNLDALKTMLQERANLEPEQAEQAARVALEFFSEKVPGLAGLMEQGGGVEGIAKRLGGLLGR